MSTDFVVEDFLDAAETANSIDWAKPAGAPVSLNPLRVEIGFGPNPLEVVIVESDGVPKADDVRKLWRLRWAQRANPVLVVAAYRVDTQWEATVCGPDEGSAAITGLDLRQIERTAAAALKEQNASAAKRTLAELLVSTKDQLVTGLINQGLFASHELRNGVPTRPDWVAASKRGAALLTKAGADLIAALGYSTTPVGSLANVLSANGLQRAVAVLLDETELFDRPGNRFGAVSPVTHGLAVAQERGLPWLVVVKGPRIRLYPAKPDVGVGRKGQAETYVELNVAHLTGDDAGYLPLIFGPDALSDGGSVSEILAASVDHAAGLGARLRERVYVEVVPRLAVAVAMQMEQAKGAPLTDEDLSEAYHRTLVILFRLLFVSYAEDRGLLPYNRNPRYTNKALKTIARDLAADSEIEFDADSYDRWDDLQAVWRAVDQGNREWDVPAYNGGLFNADADLNPSGHAISLMRLSNAAIGPALKALLVDDGEDGVRGPVDFRALSVREFGTIYEGLLESSLSIAPTDLTVDPDTLAFIPSKKPGDVVVAKDEVYFHNASGARKSTGSYFTKAFAVEHLLDTALEPALTNHLSKVADLLEAGDGAAAAETFFDFRVADLAMGSGHFLVAAIDRIEARLMAFLHSHPIPEVSDELVRLAAAATQALPETGDPIEIEPSMLLRRQVARRCVYGLDLNLMAVELARLAIWIHTFVPGLPMSSLAHGLRVGNSLTGITTIQEALEVFEPKAAKGEFSLFAGEIEDTLATARENLLRVARTDEATKKEVHAAAEAHARALADAAHVRALFDAAVAIRLGLAPLPSGPDEAIEIGNREDVVDLIARLQSAHMPFLFPEVFLRDRPGFDVLLGNPPWDKVRHEPQQFWVVRDPGLNAMPASARDAHVELLRATRPQDAAEETVERELRETLQQVAKTGFSRLGTGHFDFAKMFAERYLTAGRAGGAVGVVMPQALLLLGGWSKLREALLDRGDVIAVQTRNSNGWMFDDVHKSYAIVLFTLRPPTDKASKVVSIYPGVNSLPDFERALATGPMVLPLSDIDDLSDGRVVPWFNAPDDGAVFDKMRSHHKLAAGSGWIAGRSDSSRWDFSGSGKHKAFGAASKESSDAWGVMMTRHVDQFVIANDPIRKWVNDPVALAQKQPERGVTVTDGRAELGPEHPVIVYRFPSRNDDSRTLIATALPSEGYFYSTGYCHGIAQPTGTPVRSTLALLGYVNSVVADWWARRFVDRHVGSRIINGLPLPDWNAHEIGTAATLVTELLVRGGLNDVAGGIPLASEPALAALTDRDLRLRLDALAASGFGLDEADMQVILSDFKDKPESVPSGYRTDLLTLVRQDRR